MSSSSFRRRAVVAVAAVAAAAAVAAGSGASAATSAEPPSTPVPIATPDGQLTSYVINGAHTDSTDVVAIKTAVRRAGGVVVQAWPQIGVVIAHADKAAFATKVTGLAGAAVASLAPTRTVAVSEGTPAGIATTWGPRASTVGPKAAVKADPAGDPESAVAAKAVPDPREAEQWDMAMIKADKAHNLTDGSPSVVVGVLDSGIDHDHPDLQANIDVADSVNCTDAGRPDTSADGWWPTTSSHGTHVAGTIAAARNGVGIVGVAPAVRLASVKVVNDDGFIYPEYAICGFMWAGQKGMDVTNSSYYVDPFEFYCGDQPEQAAPMEAVRRAVEWSTSKGVAHAAAAGNSAVDLANKTTDAGSPDDGTPVQRTLNSTCKDIPTELPGVVTVSALSRVGTTLDSTLATYSNRGKGVIDVAAPGSNILSTVVDGYANYSGTSMASPHVAGVLALLKSTHPSWTPEQLVATVRAEADAKACGTGTPACIGRPADNSYFGQGIVDANQAVRQ